MTTRRITFDAASATTRISPWPAITPRLSTLTTQVGYNVIIMWGGTFACMQQVGGPLVVPIAACQGGFSTGRGLTFPITVAKTYWINMKYDGSVAKLFLAAHDPDNSYSLVGYASPASPLYGESLGGKQRFRPRR